MLAKKAIFHRRSIAEVAVECGAITQEQALTLLAPETLACPHIPAP